MVRISTAHATALASLSHRLHVSPHPPRPEQSGRRLCWLAVLLVLRLPPPVQVALTWLVELVINTIDLSIFALGWNLVSISAGISSVSTLSSCTCPARIR